MAFTERGTPWSEVYGDVYHPEAGGTEQARHVFLAGNGLPARWRGRTAFTVLETGFGLGFNFLETWRTARADPTAPLRLHFVSVEKHPVSARDLARAHGGDPLAAALAAVWPPLLAGLHRLHFDGGRVTLTLGFGDARALLPQIVARADAIYLDGFAPARNPDMWSPEVLTEIGRHASPASTVATWSVATAVRDGLGAAGFEVATAPGFARKREMLVGRKPGATVEVARDRRACVVGGGLAGTCVAERLAARGWSIRLVEREAAVGRGASGNPAGVVQPVLNLADAPNARLSRAAFLYALHRFRDTPGLEWRESGALRIARDAAQQARFATILERLGTPPEYARLVDANDAAACAGARVGGAGVWFPAGAWVSPPSLCMANLASDGARIESSLGASVSVTDLQRLADDALVIDATAGALHRTLPVAAVRGQVTYLPPSAERRLAIAVTGDGYIAPMPGGGHCAGASFAHDDFDLTAREADHVETLARVERMLPGFASGLDAAALAGRAALRITTPDRVPVYGLLAERRAVATGLGARGLIWAPLCAELLAAQLEDEPWPVERELADALSPLRFAMDAAR